MRIFLKTRWKECLIVLLLFAAVLRTGNLFAALDYDEIWTLTYFSAREIRVIFTELSLPNNQVLNSLFVKLLFSENLPLWGIRLHSFIAGILAVMLMIPVGIRLGRSRGSGFWSSFFLLVSAPAVLYSQLARGYELQLFFLLLYTWGLLYSSAEKWKIPALGAVVTGGVCSILALSTSVIYLSVITAGFFILRPKFPGKALTAVLGGGIIFALLWYGINFHQFRTGQQWGTVISTHKEFFTFAFSTLDRLIPLLWCPFLVAGLLLMPRKTGGVLAGGIFLVLLTAVVTRGGGPRVYIPLVIPAALICGIGCDRLCRRLPRYAWGIAGAVLICGTAGFYSSRSFWTPADWYALFALGKSQSPQTLVIYSGTGGFPVMWNNRPGSIEDNAARINEAELRQLFCFAAPGILNGVDEKFNEKQLALKTGGKKFSGGILYDLERISAPADGDGVILVSSSEEKSVDRAVFEEVAPCGTFLRLNIFFEEQTPGGPVNVIRGGIIRNASLFNWGKLPEKMKLYRIKSGKGGTQP